MLKYITIFNLISVFNHILIFIGLIIGSYTLYLLRSNTNTFYKKESIQGIISKILNILINPDMLALLIIMFFIALSIRFVIFGNFNFSISYDYFSLFYLINFCLWLPIRIIFSIIMMFYTSCFIIDFESIKSDFTFNKLGIILIFTFISFSLKCTISLLISCKFIDFKYLFEICNKTTRNLKLIFNNAPPNAIKGGIRRISVPNALATLGVSLQYSNTINENIEINASKFENIQSLYKRGYILHQYYNLLLPNDFNLNKDGNILKQISDNGLNKVAFIKTTKNKALPLTYVKDKISRVLKKQLDLFRVKDFPTLQQQTPVIWNSQTMRQELNLINAHPKDESLTYGYMNRILTTYFADADGYLVVPQGRLTQGEPDFIVKRHGRVAGIVESKALEGQYSFTDTYMQATEYANRNHHEEQVWVVIMKGPYASFGIFIPDFHSKNGFNTKFTFFDGYVGLQVDKTYKVLPIPQRNTIELQHRLYKFNNNNDAEQNICMHTLLKHLSDRGVDVKSLDWGNHNVDSDGDIDIDTFKNNWGNPYGSDSADSTSSDDHMSDLD